MKQAAVDFVVVVIASVVAGLLTTYIANNVTFVRRAIQ